MEIKIYTEKGSNQSQKNFLKLHFFYKKKREKIQHFFEGSVINTSLVEKTRRQFFLKNIYIYIYITIIYFLFCCFLSVLCCLLFNKDLKKKRTSLQATKGEYQENKN